MARSCKLSITHLFRIVIGFLIGSSINWNYSRQDVRISETRTNFLLVAILVSDNQLEARVRAVRETFGRRHDLADIMFFLSDKNATVSRVISLYGFSIVYLPGLDKLEYPPRRKMFEMMKYLYRNYLHQYQWFARVDQDTYVNLERLRAFLLSLDSNQSWYIGKKGTGRANDIGKLGLPAAYNYCMGGCGVFLSRRSLACLGPHLDTCKRNRFTLHEDTELARCIQLHLNISCSAADVDTAGLNILSASQNKQKGQVVELFHHEYTPENNHQAFDQILRTTGKFVLTFHPLKQVDNFYRLRHVILKENLNFRMLQTSQLRREIRYFDTILQQRKLLIRSRWSFALGQLQKLMALESYQINSLGRKEIDHTSYWEEVNGTLMSSLTNPLEFLQLDLFFQRRNVVYDIVRKATWNYYQTEGTTWKMALDSTYTKLVPNYGFFFQFPVSNRNGPWPVQGIVHSVLKFEPPIFMNEGTDKLTEKIHIIIPLFKRALETKRFVDKIITMDKRKIGLLHFLFVIYKDVNGIFKKTLQTVQSLDTIQPEVTYQRLLLNGSFSRAAAINAGAAIVPSGLLFILDVDIILHQEVFNRIRRNTIRGESIFFPIVFSQFFDVCLNSPECPSRPFFHYEDVSGFWRYFGNGMLAIYKSDFNKLGSLNANSKEWGGEDTDFFDKCLLSTDHRVFQSADPGLVHLYHPKNCSGIRSWNKRLQCQNSRSLTFASTASLAKKILQIPEIINNK